MGKVVLTCNNMLALSQCVHIMHQCNSSQRCSRGMCMTIYNVTCAHQVRIAVEFCMKFLGRGHVVVLDGEVFTG
jgi:hypothetical protein